MKQERGRRLKESATAPSEAVKNSDNRSVTVAARKHAAMRSTAYISDFFTVSKRSVESIFHPPVPAGGGDLRGLRHTIRLFDIY